jgi:hypothetical protein
MLVTTGAQPERPNVGAWPRIMTKIILGAISLVVVICHASWKWGGAGGKSYPGTFGTVGPVFFGALLLWPMFAVSAVCIATTLFGPPSPGKSKTRAIFFLPIILYGIYFLVVGGSSFRAGAG